MHSNEALALSDMDATYFELEQAALERSLQAEGNFEHGKKQKATTGRRRKQGRVSPSHAAAGAAGTAMVPTLPSSDQATVSNQFS